MPGKHTTVADAWASIARTEPILQIEGRDISDEDKKMTVELICGIITLDDVKDRLLRAAGYGISPVQPPARARARRV
ncbi:hypothetical protein [Prescottella subtropica]|uniref:hypothetical protein n=1 Tax=Prescottella subtropica TaxID=2545757 RepID=UPI0010F9AC4E|nr:hypothetical protein [Prescottella subtropica]